MQRLKDNYPKWDYRSAPARDALVDGSFVLKTYSAVAPISGNGAYTIGAQLHVLYNPLKGNPQPIEAKDNIHWIQRIANNYMSDGKQGDEDDRIDTLGKSPYYDEKVTADATQFCDWPNRDDRQNEHRWDAEVYLAVGPPPKIPATVMLYNGIVWG